MQPGTELKTLRAFPALASPEAIGATCSGEAYAHLATLLESPAVVPAADELRRYMPVPP